ncbi:MAG: hypothetical protein RR835_03935 [Peptostreptococcaceae bacterium]
MEIKAGTKVIAEDFLTNSQKVLEIIGVYACLDNKNKEEIGRTKYKGRMLSNGPSEFINEELFDSVQIKGVVVDIGLSSKIDK